MSDIEKNSKDIDVQGFSNLNQHVKNIVQGLPGSAALVYKNQTTGLKDSQDKWATYHKALRNNGFVKGDWSWKDTPEGKHTQFSYSHPAGHTAVITHADRNGTHETSLVAAQHLHEDLLEGYSTTEAEAHELMMHADNDQILHNQKTPFIENMKKKIAKGTYDHSKAPKLWKHYTDRVSQDYAKVNKMGTSHAFSPDARRMAAQHYADEHHAELTESVQAGEYTFAFNKEPIVEGKIADVIDTVTHGPVWQHTHAMKHHIDAKYNLQNEPTGEWDAAREDAIKAHSDAYQDHIDAKMKNHIKPHSDEAAAASKIAAFSSENAKNAHNYYDMLKNQNTLKEDDTGDLNLRTRFKLQGVQLHMAGIEHHKRAKTEMRGSPNFASAAKMHNAAMLAHTKALDSYNKIDIKDPNFTKNLHHHLNLSKVAVDKSTSADSESARIKKVL